jgi:hypothetical protein
MVGEALRISQFKQQVMEELRAQRVCIWLVSLPVVVASSSHTGGDEHGLKSIASTNVDGMVNAPFLSSNYNLY